MDYMQSFSISALGMNVERIRAETASVNLANANTVHESGRTTFRPMRAVVYSTPGKFSDLISGATTSVPSVRLEAIDQGPRLVHEPNHPMADSKGMVAYVAVDPAIEMMTLMTASRSYEANVAAMNTARSLALKALEIGGNT